MSKLEYVPLGGLGEVGLNMWALEWEGQVLVVDAGLMFPQEDMLGIDLVIPDISHLLEGERKVCGIFLTHGHEDHIGALPFVLRRLAAETGSVPPVYGTRLTLGLVAPKLREHRFLRESDLREVRVGDEVQLGPFRVETVAVCHSIPDAVALSIGTPVGRVLYTGDFKLDAAPLDGRPTDLRRLAQIGHDGVLLMLSDSTNAERAGYSGSERELVAPFEAIFRDAPGRIAVATFASNIYRLQQVVRLTEASGRRLAVIGRSLVNNFRTARELGFLDVPGDLVVRLDEVEGIDDNRLVLLTAGSQGEPMSALTRFASMRHPVVNVRAGDWVVISATPIPGNELLVHRTINNLYKNGARVFYSQVGRVHVSGHAYRDELKLMLSLIRPRFFIPVHGEYRQLLHHADIAGEVGLKDSQVLIVEDGDSVELSAESMEKGPKTSAGLVFVDGLGIGDVEQVVLRDRRRLAEDGIVFVTIAVDRDTGAVRAGPEWVSRGFMEPELSAELMDELREDVLRGLARASKGMRETSVVKDVVKDAIHDSVSRRIHQRTKRRPMVIPVVTEI
ncbi:MAG: ribonuclease J [Candidatus Dormibacteraceae bacterium]